MARRKVIQKYLEFIFLSFNFLFVIYLDNWEAPTPPSGLPMGSPCYA